MMNVQIYVLIDPITSKIRYIGRTTSDLKIRLNGHMSKARYGKTHKDNWIKGLLKLNLKPKIKLFKIVDGWDYSHKYEKTLITKSLNFGFNLVNLDDRGEGGINKVVSLEQKAKISQTLKNKYSKGLINPTRTTNVSVFNLEGDFLSSFKSLATCSKTLKIPYSSLEKVLAKRTKRWKGYQITYGENPGKYKMTRNPQINCKSLLLKEILTDETILFSSYKELASFLNTSITQVRRYLKSQNIYQNKYTIHMPV